MACVILAFVYLPGSFADFDERRRRLDMPAPTATRGFIASAAVVIGIVLAAGILALTGYFTGTEYRPVKDVGKTSLTGAATVILSGLAVGFESAVYTALVIGAPSSAPSCSAAHADGRRCSRWRWPAAAC